MSHRDELIRHSAGFLDEIKEMTPSIEAERWLN
jgi:hypothetical protein